MKIHLDLDCYFVSAERTRYSFLKNRPVVVAKGSDKKIFSCTKKEVKAKGIKADISLKKAFEHCKNLLVVPCDHLFISSFPKKLTLFLLSKAPILESNTP